MELVQSLFRSTPPPAPSIFAKAGNCVNKAGQWLIASPQGQPKRSEWKIICWLQDFTGTAPRPVTQQTKFERGCTIAKRCGLVLAGGLATAGAGYLMGVGLRAFGTELIGRFTPVCKEIEEGVTDALCNPTPTKVGVAMQYTGMGLEKAGDAMTSVSRGLFLTISVPAYGVAYAGPKAAYEHLMPSVVDYGTQAGTWLMEKAITPSLNYCQPATTRTSEIFWGVVNPLADMTVGTANEISSAVAARISKLYTLIQ